MGGRVKNHLKPRKRRRCNRSYRDKAYLRIPDHADQRSGRMPITDSGSWRSGFRTDADH